MIPSGFPLLRVVAGSVFLSLSATLPVLADDGYVLAVKGEVPKEGTTFRTEVVTAADNIVMKGPGEGGKPMEVTGSRKDTLVMSLEGLAQGKIRRVLASSKTEGEFTVSGRKTPPPEERDMLLEAPLVGTREDGKWTFKLEEGEPYEMQKGAITRFGESFSKEPAVALYGTAPRKPGDKWEAAPGFYSKSLFGTLPGDCTEGKVSLEFVEVKEFQGTSCALLKIAFDINSPQEKAARSGTGSLKGSGTIYRSLADRVDFAWQLKVDFKGGAPAQGMEATSKTTVTGKTTVTRAK